MIHHINISKGKIHMIIPMDEEKGFDKNSTFLLIQILNKLGREGTYLNIIKGVYNKLIPYSVGKYENFLTKSSNKRQGFPLSSLLFNIVLGVLAG
jgi:hypothetical protein